MHIVEESVNFENLEIRDDDGLKALAQASFFVVNLEIRDDDSLKALAQASFFVVELNFPESV